MDCDYTLITNVERVRSKNDPLIVNCTAVLLSNVAVRVGWCNHQP